LAKHRKPHQRFRLASADPLLPTAKSQVSIHNLAEIGNYYDLLSDRVVSIALFGNRGRIDIEVFIQRPLSQPFNRA
jgi:hypothetical protein